MKKRLLYCILFAQLLPFTPASGSRPESGLRAGFLDPPAEARPHAFWHWISGHITKEGIRADLEDMHRAGIAGVELFDVGTYPWRGPVDYGTEEWLDHVQYALHTADSLDMELIPMCGAGWATAGGPWITPEQAMKELVWSSLDVPGGKYFEGVLPQPVVRMGYYREIALLAIPADEPEPGIPFSISTNIDSSDAGKLADGDLATVTEFPNPHLSGRPAYVQFEYAAPRRASLLTIRYADKARRGFEGTVLASDDGREFRQLRQFDYQGQFYESPEMTIRFPATTARFFRVEFHGGDPVRYTYRIAEMDFSDRLRLDNYHAKTARSLLEPNMPAHPDTGQAPGTIGMQKIIDLTDKLAPGGTLRWNVPPGKWTLLRFGYTVLPHKNHPTTKAFTGLEGDKMDASITEFHFSQAMGSLLKRCDENGYELSGIFLDSYEAATQTWTQRFREEFRKRTGYDMTPFLPALTGRVVGSEMRSECFLWDYRKVISDLIAENFYGKLRQLIHARGLRFYGEPYGGYFDDMRASEEQDVLVGEFWNGYITNNTRFTASAAHISGRNIVGAEAFTAQPHYGSFANTPFSLKRWGDLTFTEGLTWNILHSYVHQPYEELKPGFTLSRYGTHFGRHNTWWRCAPAWISYLSSCQYLLRQGNFVADICYLRPSDIADYTRYRRPCPPRGYNYDLCNDRALERMSTNDDGSLQIADMRYRILVLQPWNAMPMQTLRRLHALVQAGATLIGPAPRYPASLRECEADSVEFRRLTADLWGGQNVHYFGKGRTFKDVSPESIEKVLQAQHIAPDFEFEAEEPDTDIAWIHRSTPEAEIYFIANQSLKPVSILARFRIEGRAPQFWNAADKTIARPEVFRSDNGKTEIPIQLPTHASLFVVFPRETGSGKTIHSVSLGQEELISVEASPANVQDCTLPVADAANGLLRATRGGDYTVAYNDGSSEKVRIPHIPEPLRAAACWDISFPVTDSLTKRIRTDSLRSWTDNPDPDIRYFSGTATYRTTFDIPSRLLRPGIRLWLCFREMHDTAEISVNGTPAGILWTAPWRMEIGALLHPGTNTFEIKVSNRWANRLIGDEQFSKEYESRLSESDGQGYVRITGPDAEPLRPTGRRRAASTWRHYDAGSPLQPSGLVGNITIIPAYEKALKK